MDNFEAASLSSQWFAFSDTNPPNAFTLMRSQGGATGTANAGHYLGSGAKTTPDGGFGAGIALNVAIDTTAKIYCVDVSAFDGISFWAKGTSPIVVQFAVPATTPTDNYGDCTANCYKDPGKTVTLTADWTPYAIAFSSAIGASGAKVDGRLEELVWGVNDRANCDFWLDEIAFYKGTPPTGPVTH